MCINVQATGKNAITLHLFTFTLSCRKKNEKEEEEICHEQQQNAVIQEYSNTQLSSLL